MIDDGITIKTVYLTITILRTWVRFGIVINADTSSALRIIILTRVKKRYYIWSKSSNTRVHCTGLLRECSLYRRTNYTS